MALPLHSVVPSGPLGPGAQQAVNSLHDGSRFASLKSSLTGQQVPIDGAGQEGLGRRVILKRIHCPL
jgi:hypothetical protein